jgi:Rhs element Vgr protein
MITPGTAHLQNRETHKASVTVKIDGKDITSNPGGLISLSVYQELNKIPTAKIIFSDGAVEKQSFEKSNSGDLLPGKAVEIFLGYSEKEDIIFKGVITRHGVKVLANRPYHVEIECKDISVKSTLVRKSRYHYSQTDASVIKDILSAYKDIRSVQVDNTDPEHHELVQYNVTDWDFVLLRADANGLYVQVKDGSVSVKKPEVKSKADLQVQFGIGNAGLPILEFESDIDLRNTYAAVKATSWDYTQQQLMEEKEEVSLNGNTSSLYNDPVQLYHGGDLETKELQAWVKSKYKRGELSRIRGRVSVGGAKIYPGDTLEVNGIGNRFNGRHLVTGVVHQLIRGQWKTDIQFGWSKEFCAETMESHQHDASGLMAGIRGLHIGVVSKIEGDDVSGNHRVQVRLPFVAKNPDNTTADGSWARLANVYAGDKRGFIFRPEIGDEVIVGFINNDPNDAVIIGALNSTKYPAPDAFPASDTNPKKGFVAKGGMQVIFDDDAKKIIMKGAADDSAPMIQLDANAKKIMIKIGDSNSIELSSSGVKITGTRIDLN